jgi:poly(hydroxyalkanoate) depolymerase family esterase
MKMQIHPDMIEATRLTQAGKLTEATALLQRLMFSGGMRSGTGTDGDQLSPDASARGEPHTKGEMSGMSDAPESKPSSEAMPKTADSGGNPTTSLGNAHSRPRILRALRAIVNRIGRIGATRSTEVAPTPPASSEGIAVPPGAQFLTASYAGHAGTRVYKLYVPSTYRGRPLPLIVMLHGCTQSADDFATGTRMNVTGEAHSCFVAYPVQPQSANGSKCWNWFSPRNQLRGRGEPSLIAGIVDQIMRDFAIDRKRVYVAGLSAGGATAAVLGTTYPDIFAAVGVHSGLAHGAARNVPTAFAAMRHGAAKGSERSSLSHGHDGNPAPVPTIVFHGAEDRTVHPRNADQVIEQSLSRGKADLRATTQHGRVTGGHGYTRTSYLDANGHAVHEMWTIHAAGHAWSGGSPAGSHTDPRGPDASREMLRFFLEHPHKEATITRHQEATQ